MIAASARLRGPNQVHSVQGGIVTYGAWISQAARESLTASPTLAPRTPQKGLVGLSTPPLTL